MTVAIASARQNQPMVGETTTKSQASLELGRGRLSLNMTRLGFPMNANDCTAK